MRDYLGMAKLNSPKIVPARRSRKFDFHANIGLDGNPESDLFSDMASFKKPDPELLPIGRPRCPDCSIRMLTVDIVAGPEGFEHRTFECSRCGHSEKKVLTCDPLKSNAIGWLASELKPPA
jgi:hypothetical protein